MFTPAERVRIVGRIRAFEAGGRVLVVFRVDEDGEGLIAVEGDAVLEVLPLVIVNLDGELPGALVVFAAGWVFEALQIADFVGEGMAIEK